MAANVTWLESRIQQNTSITDTVKHVHNRDCKHVHVGIMQHVRYGKVTAMANRQVSVKTGYRCISVFSGRRQRKTRRAVAVRLTEHEIIAERAALVH